MRTVATLLGCALSLFLLRAGGENFVNVLDPPPVAVYKWDPFRYLSAFAGCIGAAFFIEAYPRGSTRVQRVSREKENLTLYDQANLFSRWTFYYTQPMMSLGATRTLTAADIDEKIVDEIKARPNFDRVSGLWDRKVARYRLRVQQGKVKDMDKAAPSLLLTVFSAYKGPLVPTMIMRVISFGLMYVPIYLFRFLLQFFTDYGEALKNGTPPPAMASGILIALGIFFGNVISALFLSISSQDCSLMALGARNALQGMVYRKALRLSPDARRKSTLGEITSHMAVDAEVWLQSQNFLPLMITIPFEIIVGVVLLYRLLGWCLIVGLGTFMVISPIQTRMAKFMHSYQRNKLKTMDARLRMMSEILANIKIVKLYSWESAFRKRIDVLRDNELAAQKALATIRSVLTIVFSSVNLFIVLATFTVYANWGGPDFSPAKMTPEVIFVGIALFTFVGRPMGLVPLATTHLIMLQNSSRRIQKYLLLEEIDDTMVLHHPRVYRQNAPSNDHASKKKHGFSSSTSCDIQEQDAVAIKIENASFSWEKEVKIPEVFANTTAQDESQPLLSASSSTPSTPPRQILSNINLEVQDGSLTTVVGRVGAGKSSLISAIIGEMYKQPGGQVQIWGDVALVPQQAWILNASLKNNILLGKPFEQDRYDRVVYACGLLPDIEMLPAADLTEIGERGINLSGGQKQRVSLARAAYQDADIYLLDDPLSAVDAHVDQHLWKHLIGPEGLLKDKTRLLVTHGIHHLDAVDSIVVVKDGMITETGEYKDLMHARKAFYQLITDYSVQEKKKSKHAKDESQATQVDVPISKDDIKNIAPASAEIKAPAKKVGNGGLIGLEKIQQGKVTRKIYLDYARAISYRKAIFCLFMYGFGQACQISTSFWLRYWVTADEREDTRSVAFFLGGYAVLVGVFLVVDVLVNYTANVICGIQGAKVLHNNLLTRVLLMPMSFFDTTPMGRIVNVFSSDVSTVDSSLAENLPALLGFSATVCGILLVISYSTPLFLIAVPPLGLVFYYIQDYYIRSSSSLKRLQAVSKSPLYQHFSESLAGVSTIRATRGLSAQFLIESETRADVYAFRTYMFNMTNRWLTIRIQTLCSTVIFVTAALAVLNADNLDPSLVGLALTFALNLTMVISITVRTMSEVQNQLVSVERIQEYSTLPIEAPLETGVHLPEHWPAHGRIAFKGFSARYREGLDLCIQNANFTIEPQQKIGVVGRTGAGKSSLTLALFRIIEAADSYWARASDPQNIDGRLLEQDQLSNAIQRATSGGAIEIDGVDISTLGLRTLRSHLAIIPQDPTLFAGTIRDNLDPFHEHEDADLWEALERAHLKDHISSLNGSGLSFEVAQNGENFSVGQKSLICLARALLRKSKILILDEATAAVDVETDHLIQKTIRKEFQDRTVITIAHRIKTVMDSDKILVLDQGRVQEFETPKTLLKNHHSLFYSLAHQAGEI
ncbi:Multidrug resistance-associated protein 1 [Gryganskiella cystojenkinii]|nr:Multidrug resistance-associated protein 1 [Gryganskiella cystojenkinii]